MPLNPELGKLSMPQSMNRYVYCVNNPLRFTDPTGMWLESLFDIGCIIYDIHELWKNPTWGNAGWLLLDIGCLILPGVPALSPVLKTWKWFDKANDARKIADNTDDISDIVRRADDVPTTPMRSADDISAASARNRVVVIGENMEGRVKPFAKKYGYEYMPDMPPGQRLAANRAWINARMDEGYTIIDLGPAPGYKFYPSLSSKYYIMEHYEIFARNYQRYLPLYGV